MGTNHLCTPPSVTEQRYTTVASSSHDPAPAYLPPLCNPLPYPLHYGSDDRFRTANASPHHLIRHILAHHTCAHPRTRRHLSPLVTTPTIDNMASRSSSFSSVSPSRSRASSETQE